MVSFGLSRTLTAYKIWGLAEIRQCSKFATKTIHFGVLIHTHTHTHTPCLAIAGLKIETMKTLCVSGRRQGFVLLVYPLVRKLRSTQREGSQCQVVQSAPVSDRTITSGVYMGVRYMEYLCNDERYCKEHIDAVQWILYQ